MGLLNLFKKNHQPDDEEPKEKYWSLTTSEGEVIDPTWDEIEAAIRHATPAGSLFISLGYMNADLEIEVIQATSESDIYRLEALPPENSLEYGDIFVEDGLRYEEALKLFETFHKHQSVHGYRDWMVDKNRS